MTLSSPLLEAAKKPVTMIGALVAVVIVVVWLLAFFVPQGHKLSSLQAEKASLQQTIVQDDAKIQKLKSESQHVGQIRTIYTALQGYVPATEDLYTYVNTISTAANSAGVSITSLAPSALVAAAGTSYSALPIDASIKGTYDHLLAFVKDLYALPRLTDINGIDITGGGPSSNRTSPLTVTLQLAIFTGEKPVTTTGAP